MADVVRPRLYVGVLGHHGAGKSGLIDRVQELVARPQHGRWTRVVRQSLAQPIRDGLGDLAGQPLHRKKRSPVERAALQFVGESARALDSNAWLARYFKTVDDLLTPTSSDPRMHERAVVLTDDVYHWNEAMAMDLLVVVRYPGDQPEPTIDAYDAYGQPYVAVSKRQTFAMLTLLPELLPKTTLVIEASTPEALNINSHAEFIVKHIKSLTAMSDPNQTTPRVHHVDDFLKEPA